MEEFVWQIEVEPRKTKIKGRRDNDMVSCECSICDTEISLGRYEENDIIACPNCGMEFKIVSLMPPVLQEFSEMDGDWDDDDGDWDDDII